MQEYISPEMLAQVLAYGMNLLGAVAIFVAGLITARYASRFVRNRAMASDRIDETLVPVLTKVVKIAVLVFTAIAVLNRFGVQTASIIAVLGAAGLAIGLALQGALSNVASGVMLLLFRPFDKGDQIELDGTRGIVDEIGLFVTRIHTLDNIYTVIPNREIWGGKISNYSRNKTRRIDLVVGIDYADDIDKAMDTLKDIFAKEDRVLDDPAPLVAVGELGDNAVNLLARPWTRSEDYWQTRLDLTKAIKQRFDEEGLSFPFPQRDVHLYQEKALQISANGKATSAHAAA